MPATHISIKSNEEYWPFCSTLYVAINFPLLKYMKYFKYRYLIYKVYSWSMNKKNDTPIINTTFTLAITHFFQFLFLLILFDRFIVHKGLMANMPKPVEYIFAIVYLIVFSLLIYNKVRWAGYVEEYKDESEQQRRLGNFIVISYLIVSILIFFSALPLLHGIKKS